MAADTEKKIEYAFTTKITSLNAATRNDFSAITLNIPEDLWKAAKIRAIELGMDAQDLVAKVLGEYLKSETRRKKGGRR